MAVVNGLSFILVVGHTAALSRELGVFSWIISGVTFDYTSRRE